MSKAFYEAMKARIEAGQYTYEEIMLDLDTALGKKLISHAQYDELYILIGECIDLNYDGNTKPTGHDLKQDTKIEGNTMATLENFEYIMLLEEMLMEVVGDIPATLEMKQMRSAIGDNYVRMIIAGQRTFDSVPTSKKQEVADKLIAIGREDLINEEAYLPKPEVPEIPLTPLEPSTPVVPEHPAVTLPE